MEATKLLHDLGENLAHYIDLADIELVYLFGSRASGETGPISDYDFGVLIQRDADRRQVVARFAHALAQSLGANRIDVVTLNTAPIELAYAVIAQGFVLYECDLATRVDYEAYVLGLYGDYLPFLKAHHQQILQGDDYERRVQRYREALGRTRRTLSEITSATEPHQD
jgi:predicted nucleotidyltransferase